MKRSELKRKTELKRRTRMKPVSKRKRKELRNDERNKTFPEEHPNCMKCNKPGTETHEILGGPNRFKSVWERATWLRLCRKCHDELPSVPSRWEALGQLAIKLRCDPVHRLLERFNAIWATHGVPPIELWEVSEAADYLDNKPRRDA